MSMENDGGMILTGETEELGKNLTQCQISHGLTRARTSNKLSSRIELRDHFPYHVL
jgi:hypothetical protein